MTMESGNYSASRSNDSGVSLPASADADWGQDRGVTCRAVGTARERDPRLTTAELHLPVRAEVGDN
jgi:hypothetical protein